MENNFREKKGSKSSIPGSSCKDILISGDSEGDGEYWIDPADSGDPFTVFCDMTTEQGGWTLISHFLMRDANSLQDESLNSNSYREILPNYNSNNQFLL
ncbi:intelectin-like [Oculina patagonica]